MVRLDVPDHRADTQDGRFWTSAVVTPRPLSLGIAQSPWQRGRQKFEMYARAFEDVLEPI